MMAARPPAVRAAATVRPAATSPSPTAKSLPLDRRTVSQLLGQFSVPDGDKRIAARSPQPAQRLVPLPVLGLGCSSRHSIRSARAEVINREATTGHEPLWPVTRARSGGGLAGD